LLTSANMEGKDGQQASKDVVGRRLVIATGYSDRVAFFKLDDMSSGSVVLAKQKLLSASVSRGLANASFAAIDKRGENVYAVHELKTWQDRNEGAVSRWQIDLEGDDVIQMKEVWASGGQEPAHVALDEDRHLLWVTNYTGGSLKVFRLSADGAIMEEPAYFEQYTYKSQHEADRQEAPHPHGAFLLDNLAFVVDLGADRIYIYKVNDHSDIVKKGHMEVEASSGPRHVAVDVQRARLYLLNELKNTLTIFQVNQNEATLKEMGRVEYEVPSATAGTRQYGSEVELHPSGGLLLASNRGDGAVLVFKVREDAPYLEQVHCAASNGTWPRFFKLLGEKHLLSCDQFNQKVTLFKLDEEKGSLTQEWEVEAEGTNPSILLTKELPH